MTVVGVDLAVPGSESWAIEIVIDGWRIELSPVRGTDAPYRIRLVSPDGNEYGSKVGIESVELAVELAVTWMTSAGTRPGFHARRLLVYLARDVGGAFPDATSLSVTLSRPPA